jgi:Ser/Thr protein kinase RdoA (MazF antagonist)
MNVVAKSSTQIATVISQLVRWVDRQVPLQPVLRDIWSDHLLFEGNDVRGMIDFHAVRIGTVAGDIGRLLASWNLPVDGQWDQALAWYSEIHPLETDEVEFVHVLDQAARVLTPWVWLRWVLLEKRQFASFEKMNERVEWSFRRLLAGK